MEPPNRPAGPPAGPEDLPAFTRALRERLSRLGAVALEPEVSWMSRPLPGFRVTLREGERVEAFGVPVRVLAADLDGRALDRIAADALRRLRR